MRTENGQGATVSKKLGLEGFPRTMEIGVSSAGVAKSEVIEESRSTNLGTCEKGPFVLVDGSNVAWAGYCRPRLRNIAAIREQLQCVTSRVIVMVDASLRHRIDDRETLEAMIQAGDLVQVPAGRQADEFLLNLASRLQSRGETVHVLTNDRFPEKNDPAISRIAYLIVNLNGEEEWLFSPTLDSIRESGGIVDA